MMTNPSRVAFSLFGRDIYWYGILIAAAVVIGLVIAMRSAKRYGWDQDTLIDFALWAVPSAVVGARLYYVAFEWPMFQNDLLKIFRIWEGGLAIYGGIIGGVICALIFCKCRKLSFWTLADIVAPALALGQAIGRWGNFFNQEAYGAAVTNPSLMWFPMAVRIDATNTIHYATFFYESMWCLLIFVFLMALRRKFKHRGDAMLFYLMLYALERAFVEGLRTDSLYWGSIRVSQLLSALLFVVTAVFMIVRAIKERRAGALLGAPTDWGMAIPQTAPTEEAQEEQGASRSGAVSEKDSPPEEGPGQDGEQNRDDEEHHTKE